MSVLRRLLVPVALLVSAGAFGCQRETEPMTPAAQASPQQLIVERSARALQRMRSDPDFAALDAYLARAEGVMIFPRLIRAGLVFGGEGGNGVLVARGDRGWSSPAFYSLGGGSAGLQAGYQEAAVVLVFLNRRALLDAIDGGLTLGADASVAAGTIGDTGQARTATAASDIVQFVDVGGGLFAGVSLDGAVIGPRDSHNAAYYGAGAMPSAILLEQRFEAPGAAPLQNALPPVASR